VALPGSCGSRRARPCVLLVLLRRGAVRSGEEQ